MKRSTTRALFLASAFCLPVIGVAAIAAAQEQALPLVSQTSAQPLANQVRHLVEALDYLGNPLPQDARQALRKAMAEKNEAAQVEGIQKALDPLCLFSIDINPESRVKVAAGPAKAELIQGGWRQFLVKVHNQAGVTAELKGESPQGQRLFNSPANQVADRWLELQFYNAQPMTRTLSGLELEYRIIQLYSRDAGKRSATISFNVGQGTQDVGFRAELPVLFSATPANDVKFVVKDENNQPTTAMFVIRDQQGRVYPSQAKRLAPDFAFHPQVYRSDGETLKLPAGKYTVEYTRGPEYLGETKTIDVDERSVGVEFALKRWIDPSKFGWWSGDHHIHAAGCAHYTNPTEGVHAIDMVRQTTGEDLKVGCNLTWGPCFDYQKQFFTGAIDKVSQYPYLIRYDIEVSGFGSHQSGHLCLLRLKDEMYPGGTSSKHWPTLGLNTLKWAKAQGAVVGPAHSGWGLDPTSRNAPKRASLEESSKIPNYYVPGFDGIGANEYLIDVTHMVPGPDGKLVPAVDFISTVDTPYAWELNMWYQTLNCGFRTRASGETDFPCIYQERVGLGRSYVKLDGKLDFDSWCEGIRLGRNYVGDGRSHLIDFTVGGVEVGTKGSELKLGTPGNVRATAKVAGLLNEKPDRALRDRPYNQQPYWHLERARQGDSRNVKVELIVNGYPVAEKTIPADGSMQDISFDAKIEKSSWVAMRILPSSHTNPVFVLVGDKPIRADKQSAEWCLAGVDQCWKQKERTYAAAEKEAARQAYEHAREVYRKILAETVGR